MNLYEIDAEILKCVDAETGEIINEDMLDELSLQRDAKIENISCWIKNLEAEAEAEALKAEKDKFAKRQKTAETKMNGLKKYLSSYLDGTSFESTKCKVSFRSSEIIVINEDADVPDEYIKVKYDYDKASLKTAIKSGKKFYGVTIEKKQNIQIK